MKSTNASIFIQKVNDYGKNSTPFLFIIDYKFKQPIVELLPNNSPHLFFKIREVEKTPSTFPLLPQPIFNPAPVSLSTYKRYFTKAQRALKEEKIQLLNLTQPTELESNLSLIQLYHYAKSPYKLYYSDQFVVFSPETFIKIQAGKIHSYPMKGTISAEIPHAKEKLLNNPKEIEEHQVMVESMKRDIGRIAENVQVKRFRYFDLIHNNKKALWQTSSEITGVLAPDYKEKIGDLLFSLLPAGSITGFPKKEAVQVIDQVEYYDRGYYTGVFGYFDGENLDSAVMIRFVEKLNGKLFYKSGGGVTLKSQLEKEYQELIDKIYVPVD